ncbi:MAG: IS66 family transposase zinc-finger binding domain-containing protein [Gammaproteobacteria bacterium]|nr:IS66 family transposase zinc-finger binding domain-containing protein [Gammaproteobacteria bacterium]
MRLTLVDDGGGDLGHAPERTHCDCGCELERIGTKTSEQLDVIPAHAFVIEQQRLRRR